MPTHSSTSPTTFVLPTTKGLLTLKEVAHLLRMHPQTIARWARAGMLPGFCIGRGSRWLFQAHDVQELLASGGRS